MVAVKLNYTIIAKGSQEEEISMKAPIAYVDILLIVIKYISYLID
jgi:hypothetical protein